MKDSTTKLVVEIEYEQGPVDWMKYPVKVLVNGEESSINEVRSKILSFQPPKKDATN